MAFMELKGKRVAILIDTLYQEMEVWYPFFRLQEAHVEVSFVGAEAGKTIQASLVIRPRAVSPTIRRRLATTMAW